MVNEGIVESKEEMKKKMEKMNKGASEKKEDIQEKAGEIKEGIKDKKEDLNENISKMKEGASEKKEEIQEKAGEVKEGASEKKEEIKKKAGEVQGGIKDKKEDLNENISKMKEGASEKKEEIKKKAGEFKDEAVKQKEQLKEESEAEDMNPAEKILTDIIKNFRQRTDEFNEAYVGSGESKIPNKPLVDVLETNESIILIADISGVKKKDISIDVSKNNVTITTSFKDETPIEGAKFIQKERSYGETKRSISLPTEIKSKKATANFKKCTLTITLPKLVEDIIKVNIEE